MASTTCKRHLTYDRGILHAAWALSAPTPCIGVHIAGARRGRAMCERRTSMMEILKRNSLSKNRTAISLSLKVASCTDLLHLGSRHFSKALILPVTFHLCLLDVHTLYPLFADVFKKDLPCTQYSLYGANDLFFFQSSSIQLPSAIPFLGKPLSFLLCFSILCIAIHGKYDSPSIFGWS